MASPPDLLIAFGVTWKDQAINYAQDRASFRSGALCILDANSDLERSIPFTEADRKL